MRGIESIHFRSILQRKQVNDDFHAVVWAIITFAYLNIYVLDIDFSAPHDDTVPGYFHNRSGVIII